MSEKSSPSPLLLAGLKKHQDAAKRRGRAYGLGERNPDTLPGVHPNSESVSENREASRRWVRVGKLVAKGRRITSKDV